MSENERRWKTEIMGTFDPASPVDKNKEECASCGTRRDKHVPRACPRFVASGHYAEQKVPRSNFPTLEELARGLMAAPAMDPSAGYRGLYSYITPPKPKDEMAELRAKVAALEKIIAQPHKDPFDAVLHRASRGPIDYTQWVDDEDCMTDETRGGMRPPPAKERIVF